MTTSRARTASPLVAAVLGGVLLVACSDGSSGVAVGAVERVDVSEVVEAPATVAARATAVVEAPADGTVAELLVADGDSVAAGDVLLRVRAPQVRERLAEARRADAEAAAAVSVPPRSTGLSRSVTEADAEAAEAFDEAAAAAAELPAGEARRAAEASLRQTQAQYEAARAAAEDAISRIDAGVGSLADAVAALGRAQRVQTKAAVQTAERAVAALEVTAPVGGVASFGGAGSGGGGGAGDLGGLLGQLPPEAAAGAESLLGGTGGSGDSGTLTSTLQQGAPVRAGQPLLTVNDVSALSLTAQVDETDVLLVERGIDATAELDAAPGATYEAKVESVDLSPTTSGRGGVSYLVRLSLGEGRLPDGSAAPNPRPGMSAITRLQVRTAEDAVAVPAAAVFRDGARDAVWLVTDGTARRHQVRLGAQGDSYLQVVEGLDVGDEVVVSGADRVRDGDEVG